MIKKLLTINLFLFLTLPVLSIEVYAASDSLALSVSATILSKGNCRFTNDSATLNFGNLNPLDPKPVTVSTAEGELSFSCNGNGQDNISYSITVSDSQNGTAASPAMLHQNGVSHLPYSLNLSPSAGSTPRKKGNSPPLSLIATGTIQGADYVTAPAGDYTDLVTITISP